MRQREQVEKWTRKVGTSVPTKGKLEKWRGIGAQDKADWPKPGMKSRLLDF